MGPSHRSRQRRRLPAVKVKWQHVLRAFGLAGAVYEIFVDHVDRPYVLALLGGMLGLPEFILPKKKDGNDD